MKKLIIMRGLPGSGKSQWIVSGYSHKMDGFLYIVKAVDEKEAFAKVAKLMGGMYAQFECDEGTTDGITDSSEMSIKNMTDDMNCEGSARWWWQVYIDEVKEDTNLAGAVSW